VSQLFRALTVLLPSYILVHEQEDEVGGGAWCPCHALLYISTQVRWHFINNAISGCNQSLVAYPTSFYTSHVLLLFQMASPRILLLLGSFFFGINGIIQMREQSVEFA